MTHSVYPKQRLQSLKKWVSFLKNRCLLYRTKDR